MQTIKRSIWCAISDNISNETLKGVILGSAHLRIRHLLKSLCLIHLTSQVSIRYQKNRRYITMKRLMALILMFILALSFHASSLAEEAVYDDGMTYATGFPITKEPITLKVYVMDAGALRPDMDTTKVIEYIAEKTNITLDITLLKDADQVSTMFFSGEFPDFAMSIGATSQQLANAAEAGQIVELTSYIEEVAPNWGKFFDEYSLAHYSCLDANGKLYMLPFCNFAPYDRDLRDMFMLNTQWCEELDIEVPSTIAEFEDFLIAVRDNAGTGTIPENVEPLHIYQDGNVGGYIDFFNFFGVTVANSEFVTVNNGQVEYVPLDIRCKEVLKWLQHLYSEGLIKPESFTDDWNMHAVKVAATDPTVGAYFAYGNVNFTKFTPIAPLDAENGARPTIRRQTYTANPTQAFLMFANNKYPYATMRLMDAIIDYSNPEFCETVTMGIENVVWEYNEDGRIVEGRFDENGTYELVMSDTEDWTKYYGFWNSFIGVRTSEWYNGPFFDMQTIVPNTRAYAFETTYKDYINDASTSFTGAALSGDEHIRMTELWTDIDNYRRTTFANWICGNGDIDTEWDAYIKHMQELHVEEWLELKQKSYDMINAD